MAYLQKHYKFHELDLEDCLSEIQRSKIDEYDDYLFMVLHIPVKGGRIKQIKNNEVNIFIGQNFIVTINEGNPVLRKIFDACKNNQKTRDEYLAQGTGYFLYMIVDDMFQSCFPLFDDLSKQVNEMETDVFDNGSTRDRLKDILMLKKDVINFRRIIMPERAIIAQLEHKNKKFLPEELEVYFNDIVDKIEKLWNNLENLKELIESLQETNESIISHNTNNVIKVLTIFSVLMLPLNLITGFYGMNVMGLPFAEHVNSTIFIASGLGFIVLSMIAFFKYKDWL